MQLEQRASRKLEERRKVKAFKSLKNYVKLAHDERIIEEEHNQRKAQIDNFFDNLKRRVETEKTEKAQTDQDNQEKQDLKERVR